MAMAEYDPQEAIPFWQRMNQSGGQRPVEYLSTHPAPQNRIENVKNHLPEATTVYRKSLRSR